MGEYLLGEGGVYRQRHTVAWGRAALLYRAGAGWEVSTSATGGATPCLRAPHGAGGGVPGAGWQWWDREQWREEEGSRVEVRVGPCTPCTHLTLAGGEGEHRGEYTPLQGEWCRGRQVTLKYLSTST